MKVTVEIPDKILRRLKRFYFGSYRASDAETVQTAVLSGYNEDCSPHNEIDLEKIKVVEVK